MSSSQQQQQLHQWQAVPSEETNIARLLRCRELGSLQRTSGIAGSNASFARLMQEHVGAWAEEDFVQHHAAAQYADLQQPPRSTIAAAFSCDGQVIASTHGDHTVKIVNFQTGTAQQVLEGHMRTPWVVRFNPVRPDLVASGSLDHSVIVWDIHAGQIMTHHNFGKPIATMAFHSQGEVVAVASGHKVYSWVYGTPGAAPAVILKTRKSLRALHFHPLGRPMILTAEVVERKSSSSTAAPAAPTPTNAAAPTTAATTTMAATAPALAPPPLPAQADAAAAAQRAAAIPQMQRAHAAAPVLIHPAPSRPQAPQGQHQQQQHGPQQDQRPVHATHYAHDGTTSDTHAHAAATNATGYPHTTPQQSSAAARATYAAVTATRAAVANGGQELLLPVQPEAQPPPPQSVPAPPLPQGTLRPAAAAAAAAAAFVNGGVDATGIGAITLDNNQQQQQQQQQEQQQAAQEAQEVDGGVSAADVANSMQTSMLIQLADYIESANRATNAREHDSWMRMVMHQRHVLQQYQLQQQQQRAAADASASASASPDAASAPQPVGADGDAAASAGAAVPQASRPPAASSSSQQQGAPARDAMVVDGLPVGLPEVVRGPLIPLMSSSTPEAQADRCMFDLSWGWEVSPEASAEALQTLREHRSLTLHRQLPLPSASEQPCIVNLVLWPFSLEHPARPLTKPLLQLPRTVLCSEMGTCCSPCGRMLAVCVAADEPSPQCAAWLTAQQQLQRRTPGAGSSQQQPLPVQAPLSAMPAAGEAGAGAGRSSSRAGQGAAEGWTQQPGQPLYELRVYSLDGPTFGQVLHARPVRAAHCLTSIQFSPSSQHLLVAYGRRHVTLCSLLVAEGQVTPVHTAMEVYRVRDMKLARQIAVLEDEVNVAVWHPFRGGGLLYGTKEGKLRLYRHDRREPERPSIPVLPRMRPLAADDELWAAERAARDSHSEDDP